MRDGVREDWNSKMAMSVTPHSKSKIKWERGSTPGWAAFDLKQQEKRGTEPKKFSDPYPPISNGSTFVNGSSSSAKPFSAVLQPSVDSPILTSHRNNFARQKIVVNSSKGLGNEVEKEHIIITDLEKLKKLYSWADDGFIEDILVAVNNDCIEASTVLQAMVSSGSSEETTSTNLAENRSLGDPNGDMQREQPHDGFEKEHIIITDLEKLKKLYSWADDCLIEDILVAVNNEFIEASTVLQAMVSSGSSEETTSTNLAENRSLGDPDGDMQREQSHKGFPLEDITDLAGLSVALEECLLDQKTNETGKGICETKLSDNTLGVKLISKHLITPPVEPEWEEDDIYLCHRKDAIRAIRSAAQHSRAASNAYLRGDHYSAQQLSLKAQGEWMAAEMLNSKAAQEILRIRNSSNDVWKLDLHGLHSSEAVHALQKHLWRIETQIPLNRSVPSNRIVKPKVNSPVESGSCPGMEARTDKEQAMPSQRSTILQVITGMGNHSRGQASLPVAVRSFLIENGYRFDATRPGVIAVRPKFRQH